MGNVKADGTYGTKRASAYRIIEDTLNLRDTRIFDYVYDEHGNKKRCSMQRKPRRHRRSRKSSSRRFRIGYITIAMLLIDPLYLSILCVFFGGGDMNGIALLFPEWAVRIFFGVMLVIHCLLFWRIVLPRYNRAFMTREPDA